MRVSRTNVPLIIAAVHFALVLATVAYVYTSADGQASLVWLFWSIADFPVSLLYFLAPIYSRFVYRVLEGTAAAHIFYLPHVIHGVVGTVWWFFIAWLLTGRSARRQAARVK